MRISDWSSDVCSSDLLAPLTMPTDAAEPVFLFPDLARHSFHGLPGLLADALPDAFGNALIDAWMARHGVTADAATALDRLAYMGKRSEEHTSELQSLMRISYAVFCLKKKKTTDTPNAS